MVKSKVFLKFIASYVAVLLFPVIIFSVLIYTSFVTNLKREVMTSTSRMLLQVSDNIDTNFQDLRNISRQISLNSTIAPLILSQNIDQLGIYPIYLCIRELRNYKVVNSIIDNIFIHFGDSDLVISDVSKYNFNSFLSRVYMERNNASGQFYNQIRDLQNPIVLNSQKVYSDGLTSDVISYIQPLHIGYFSYSTNLIITIKESVIRQMIHNVLGEYRGYVYILDPNNNVILSINSKNSMHAELLEQEMVKTFAAPVNNSDITTYSADGNNFIVSNVKSSNTGWRYIAAIESKQVLKNVQYIKNIYITIILMIFVIGLLLAYYFSKGNYNNVKKITDIILTGNNDVSRYEYENEWYLINNAVKKYISENYSLQNKLTDMMPVIRNNFFIHLLKGDIKDNNTIRTMVDSFKLEVEYERFVVILIAIDNYEQLKWNGSESTNGVIKITMANVAEEFSKKIGFGYAVEFDNDKIAVIIALDKTEDNSYIEILKAMSKEMCLFIKENFKLGITTAISNVYSDLSEISKACAEAEKALEYRMIKGDNAIICYNELFDKKYTNVYSYSFDQESKIVNLIRLGDSEKIKAILEDIVNKLKNETGSLDIIKCIYFEIINTAIKSLNELGIDINIEECLPEILRKKTLDEVYVEICNLYVKICEQVRLSKNSKNEDLRDKVMSYLKDNYMLSNLSEDVVAERFEVSQSYMSRYFKDQVGLCFIDYLHSLRLSKAKELLVHSRKSLGDISQEIGYNSVYNFNRVFKRYEKIAPMEYRLSMNGQKRSLLP